MVRSKGKPKMYFVHDNDECFDPQYDTQEDEEQQKEPRNEDQDDLHSCSLFSDWDEKEVETVQKKGKCKGDESDNSCSLFSDDEKEGEREYKKGEGTKETNDTEEEKGEGEKEKEEEKACDIDYGTLKPGVLVIIRDYNNKENTTSSKGSQAFIIEPGVSENGKMVSIRWVVDSRKKVLPVTNIEEIVVGNSRSKRNRTKTQYFSNKISSPEAIANDASTSCSNPQPVKKARKSPKKTGRKSVSTKNSLPKKKAATQSQRKMQMIPTISPPKLNQYVGEDIAILSHESNKKQYFLKYLFGDKLKIIENPLDGSKVLLDKSITVDGTKYHLLFSKEKEKGVQSSKFEKMTNKRYVAYYVGGEGFESVNKLKAFLDKQADFSSLALEPGKICSRLELMVSPACNLRNGVFKMKASDFEFIPENGHVGCGFAPPEFFETYFTEKVLAVQVRVFAPSLGWAKGMLMQKPGITKIQLPTSMLKVPKSCAADSTTKDVSLLVNKVFPNAASKAIGNDLEGKKIARSVLKNTKPLGAQLKNVLYLQGIHFEDIALYEDQFYDGGQLCRLRHDSNTCVGVADPTSQLPVDTVFVGGLRAEHCTDQVFVTRYPCTEQKDGRLLKICLPGWCPNGISTDNWKFLQSLPFGILIFGPSSDPNMSLPEQIADGDLDGDLYHILWDRELVEMLKSVKDGVADPFSDPAPDAYCSSISDDHHYGPAGDENESIATPSTSGPNSTHDKSETPSSSFPYSNHDQNDHEYIEWREKVGDKYQDIKVVGKVGDSSLKVQVDGQTQIIKKDEVKKNLYPFEIIGHHGTNLHIRYILENGKDDKRWVYMKDLKKEIPEAIATYALDHNLMNTLGWKWAKNHLRQTVMKRVVSHTGDGSDMIVSVLYDDATIDEVSIEEMKEDASDLLYKYASEKEILVEWRKEYVETSKENWFEVAQNHNAQLKLLRDQSRLKSKLYEAYKKKVEQGDMEGAEAFSQAYKKSLDLRKHACDIKLSNAYYGSIPTDLQVYVLND